MTTYMADTPLLALEVPKWVRIDFNRSVAMVIVRVDVEMIIYKLNDSNRGLLTSKISVQ